MRILFAWLGYVGLSFYLMLLEFKELNFWIVEFFRLFLMIWFFWLSIKLFKK